MASENENQLPGGLNLTGSNSDIKESGKEQTFQSTFDVTKLEGFGISVRPSGDDSNGLNMSNVLVPVQSVGSISTVQITGLGSSPRWNSGGAPGIATYAWQANANQLDTGRVHIYGSGNWNQFASVPSGWYTLPFPGDGGTSIKYWYDREEWEAALSGTSSNIYFDQAGCVWAGIPEAGGTFISGPKQEQTFAKNIINVYGNDNYNMTGVKLVADVTNQFAIHIANKVWENTGAGNIGDSVAIVGTSSGAEVNGNTIYLGGYGNAITQFADIPTGFYEYTLSYHDGTQQIEGTTFKVWYDKAKWEQKLAGLSNPYIYVDQLGNAWAGDPEAGGTFISGPYQSSAEAQYGSELSSLAIKEKNGEIGQPEAIAYANGNDQNLNFPQGDETSLASFVPIEHNTAATTKLFAGAMKWEASFGTVGTSPTWSGTGTGAYGVVLMSFTSGGTWLSFASSANNGIQSFNFPSGQGSVDYYYHATAWTTAFRGNSSSVAIAQNGDVYKGTIAAGNLVVDRKGRIGPAGHPPATGTYNETTTTPLTISEPGFYLVDTSTPASDVTLNIAAANTFKAGDIVIIKKSDATSNKVIIDPSASEEIDGDTTLELLNQYDVVRVISNGVDGWYVG